MALLSYGLGHVHFLCPFWSKADTAILFHEAMESKVMNVETLGYSFHWQSCQNLICFFLQKFVVSVAHQLTRQQTCPISFTVVRQAMVLYKLQLTNTAQISWTVVNNVLFTSGWWKITNRKFINLFSRHDILMFISHGCGSLDKTCFTNSVFTNHTSWSYAIASNQVALILGSWVPNWSFKNIFSHWMDEN